MVFPRRTALSICLVIFALIVGCSGGGGGTPTSPDLTDNELTNAVTHTGATNEYIWEIGEVIIDPDTLEVSVAPLRTADFTCNILKFLQPPTGDKNNLSVSLDLAGCDLPNAFIDLDCTLTHPFPGTVYWGFDVRVIVFAGGSTVGVHDASVRYPTPTELRMINADGYTRWWNRDEFGPQGKVFGYIEGVMAPKFTTNFSKVNGYKYFANGIGAQQIPPNPAEATRGVFSAGSVTREMLLQFPKVPKPFKFKYSVSAGWVPPSSSPPSSVDDFSLDANQQEAYQIVVTQDPASDAFYNPDTQEFGGDLILEIEVWDWQSGGDPAGEIGGIWIESPTLLTNQGGIVDVKASWTQSAGSSLNSVKYRGTLGDVTPNAVANQDLFITVESADPITYAPPLPNFLYPSQTLAAYQLFTADILDTTVPTIRVTSPNGGETLVIGETWEITWMSTGGITDVVIEYSIDNGADGYPYQIAATTPSDGSFIWDPVEDNPTTEALMRITDAAAVPLAQDVSDAVWAISVTSPQGWNPVPGQIQMAVDDPAPNQSTAQPDLGVQNDDAGNEGAWLVDQEGGIDDGTPWFYDYLLDWSGPGGDEYPSGLSFNVAPLGRHDVGGPGVSILGSSENTNQINPPLVNDPFTGIWYLSYIIDDGTASAGDLSVFLFGDTGTADPPADDPDERPWYHLLDGSGGSPADHGLPIENDALAILIYSQLPGAPDPETLGTPGQYDSGDMVFGLRQYPFDDPNSNIYHWGMNDWTTDNTPAPVFQAFDVSDPTKVRMTLDNDSYLVTGWVEPNEDLAVPVYMIDSTGCWYGTLFELEYSAGMVHYLLWSAVLKIRPEEDPNDLYLDDATMVDLETLPTIRFLYDGDYEQDKNWCAVVYDDNAGNYVLRVYRIDWTVEDLADAVTIVDTCDPTPGTPLALDVDPINFEVHVIADNGGTVEATVFNYTP